MRLPRFVCAPWVFPMTDTLQLLRLTQMGDRTVPVGRGLLHGCRPHGRGRQAYRDVLTAFHGEDLAGPEIAVSLVTHLGKPHVSTDNARSPPGHILASAMVRAWVCTGQLPYVGSLDSTVVETKGGDQLAPLKVCEMFCPVKDYLLRHSLVFLFQRHADSAVHAA
jgi:hypothetical protein